MLTRYKHGKWTVLYSDEDANCRKIFEDFVSGKKDGYQLLADTRTGSVYSIELSGKKYILKQDLRKRHRFDYMVQSFFRGSNSFRLVRGLSRAFEKDPKERCAVHVYLAADRRRFRCVLESYIVMEFIDGVDVDQIPDGIARYGKECARIVDWLHTHKMVHGDIHAGNFRVENGTGTVRAFDLAGKVASKIAMANDRIWLEQIFGIKNEKKDLAYYIECFRIGWRDFFHRLKGKNRLLH